MLILWEEEEDKLEYYQYGINTTKKKIFSQILIYHARATRF